jgi:hypothetical protein
VTPKFISPADPAARWTGAHGGQAFFGYSANYLIDAENAIIVDVEAATAIRQAEVLAAKRFDLYPATLIGDTNDLHLLLMGLNVTAATINPDLSKE